jgi:hypothetical protein
VHSVRPPALAVLVGLVVAAVVSATLFAPSHTGDLDFFVDAYRGMVGDEGLRVYAERPNIQSGPIALLSIGLLADIGDWSFPFAVALLYVAAIATLFRMDAARDRGPLVLGLGGLISLAWWRTFAFQGHLDDAATIALAVIAVAAVERRRHCSAAVALGVALAIKPWAVFLLPVLMRPTDSWRRRVALPCISLSIGAITWAPFLLASGDTIGGAKPSVWVAPDSVFRLLTGEGSTMPTWLRLAQLTCCAGAVAWVTLRGHVASALLLGVSVRLLFDGGTWPYYTAGLMMGALLWDVLESDYRIPWATIAATALLPKPTWIEPAEVRALMRLVACLGSIALVLWTVRRGKRSTPVGPTSVGSASVEGGDGADGASQDGLVELDAETGRVGQLEPASVGPHVRRHRVIATFDAPFGRILRPFHPE